MNPDPMRGKVVLDRVSRSLGGVPAVRDMELTVRAGEFLSLLGPSGCGKTTTLRMLAGFERPDTGSITISGLRVDHLPPNRRDVNTVFQSYALFPHLDVAQNVAYGLRQRRTGRDEIRRRVADVLDLVQLTAFAHRKPDKLSGGQQQRVALARAIVNRPSVLLLDEPLAALDRQLREQMQVDLKLLQAELGMTFIFVTHDQGEAMAMSDRIAVMSEGRIEQLDEPSRIYDDPRTPFVARFIGQQNFLTGVVDPDGHRVCGSDWRLTCAAACAGPPGSVVSLAVRPESIRIGSRPQEGPNVLRCQVVTVANLGLHVRYVVRLDGGQELVVVGPREAEQFRPPDTVYCVVDPRRVITYPTEGTAVPTASPALLNVHEPGRKS